MDKKVEEVLQRISRKGETREKISVEMGFSSIEKLNRFMNRNGYYWDRTNNKYYIVLKDSPKLEEKELKARIVVSHFCMKDPDPNTIAKGVGFANNQEMAKFMNSIGYAWSVKERNYILLSEIDEREKVDKKLQEERMKIEKEFLDFIDRNAEEVEQILNRKYDKTKIIKYLLPGISALKSFYISFGLCQLVIDFSRKYKISQRQILEVALVDFFRRYGHEGEINKLIRR